MGESVRDPILPFTNHWAGENPGIETPMTEHMAECVSNRTLTRVWGWELCSPAQLRGKAREKLSGEVMKLSLSKEVLRHRVTMKKQMKIRTPRPHTFNGMKMMPTSTRIDVVEKVASACMQWQMKASTFQDDLCFHAGLRVNPLRPYSLVLLAVIGFQNPALCNNIYY